MVLLSSATWRVVPCLSPHSFIWPPSPFLTMSPIINVGTDAPPTSSFTLDNTLGAVIIGFAASCALYGILLTQAWSYYRTFASDSIVYKFLVMLVVILCMGDQALIGHFTYFYALASVGNPLAMFVGTTTWSIILQQTVSTVIGAIVKCAFATRVYRFSERNFFITAFIVLLVLGQMAVALIFTIQAFGLSSIPAVFQLRTIATISIGLGVGTDVVIAAALCFFLNRLRTGYKPADSLVKRLVVDTINTGVLTTAVSLTTLLLFDFNSGNLVFLATFFQLSKLYGVSFLATLNTRRAVRGRGTDAETGAVDEQSGLPSAIFPMRSGSSRPSNKRQQEETNIFALGTRVPSFHEGDYSPNQNDRDYPFMVGSKLAVRSPEQEGDYSRGLQPHYAY
ncbi:hypothetical protein MIND_01215200 [Mycena indigotica]|uniref:DUF6534 domain-containing protein n=1 Tax=Mycena indigotica TaxID=2126181 RepID=A0A8H6VS86_9AGAR|nr:uncharacterized protein MIND_01215200 [Mycena indigotica]KAF7291899.1 hypothetical protein MIND_01215200 [Mycena indigotica]